jgi:hypothetical protein
MRFIAVILVIVFTSGCNESLSFKDKSKAERIAEESCEKNPLKKGRYECWKDTDSGRVIAPPFYILSNDMYQVDDGVGKYRYDGKQNTIDFKDGPFSIGRWAFTGRYLYSTDKNIIDSLGEPIIEILEKDRTVLRCSCSIFMY